LFLDFFHNAVAVAFPIGKRQQDVAAMKNMRAEGRGSRSERQLLGESVRR
jgi:hypothetical protein